MRSTTLLLLTCSAIFQFPLHAAIVDVPDKILATQIRNTLKIDKEDPITTEKMETLTKLKYDANNKNMVTNIEGLQYAINLDELNLNRNRITDLTPLSSLTKLRILDVGGNKNLTDYSPVADLPITRLTAYDNGILDLSSLVQIKTVNNLTISSNPITDLTPLLELSNVLLTLNISGISTLNSLEPLGEMAKLRTINMSSLPDMDLTPLSSSTSLRSISATKARFSDLSPLGALVDVTYINFESSFMTTLDGLEPLSKVTQARLRRGSLVDVSALSGMAALQILDLEDNNVVDISALTDLEELISVDLEGNKITDISPLANKEKLETIVANDNKINSVASLINLPLLKTLDLDNNNISTVAEFDAFPSLVTLKLSANNISSIGAIDKLPALKNLYVSKNQITDLTPATKVPTLVTLAAAENLISELPTLVAVPDLVTLDINKNQISDLSPVSVSSNLENLYADHNTVDTLGNWNQLTQLSRVYLRYNQITDFSTLGNCERLQYVYINDNPATILGDWTQLTLLEDLDAWNCEFEDVSGLSNAVKLKEANLYSNQISEIGDWSKLKTLSILRLDKNRLIDASGLNDCTALKTLYLHDNQIRHIGDFSKLTSLETLILNENQLNEIAVASISACTKLKDLRLAHNQLVEIGFTEGLNNLVRLDLNNNLIQGVVTFPDSFSKLQDLYLHYNQITELANTEAIQSIRDRGDELWLNVNFLDGSEGSSFDQFYDSLRELVEDSNPSLYGQTNQLVITVDYDGDGLPSDWEIANKTNAHSANANADLDGDFYTNLEEYQNQTDPNDPESFPTFAPSKIVLTGDVAEENQVSVSIGRLYAHDKDSAAGFEVISGEFSWLEAKADAESRGGHLATINSPFEERLLFATSPEQLRQKQYWIGATNTETQGEWTHWITGEPISYFPWGNGEPNGGLNEPYLELYLDPTFQFTRYPFNLPTYYPGNFKKADLISGKLESLAYQTYNLENHFIDQNLGIFTTYPTGIPIHVSQTLNIRSPSTYRAIHKNLALSNLITVQFRGYFFANEAGMYEFGNTENSGYVSFWIDFDQDGVFEHEGEKGYESVVRNWETGVRDVHLEVGYYPVTILHSTHTGSMIMNPFFRVPGGEQTTIHPALQPEYWFTLPEVDAANSTQKLNWNDEFEPSRQGYILEKGPSFELVEGPGSTHNDAFEIRNSELVLKEAMDFETTPVLSVRIRVTDRHELTYEQVFQISLTDVNEPSTAVNLSSTATPEDRPAGSLVAIILTEDPDENDEFTYELVEGEGAIDNASFVVEGNQLRTAIVIDRDVQVFYSIRLKSIDSAGHEVESIIVIEALDMPENQAPTDIGISTANIPENRPAGTPLAVLSAQDADAKIFVGGVGTYSLVYLRSATFNKAKIHAGKLGGHMAVITSKAEWDIAVKQIGKENLVGKNVLLGATDVEEEGKWRWVTEEAFPYARWLDGQPDNFTETHNTEEHHLALSAESGEALEWMDINSDLSPVEYYLLEQPMTYELVDGKGSTHNHFYKLLGNRLISKLPADFEDASNHSIRVRVTDNGGLSYEKIIVLNIQDGPDAPLGITISKSSVDENLPIRSEVGKLQMIDPDANEKPYFTLLTQTPYFYISRDVLMTLKVLDFESISSHTLEIEAKDKDGFKIKQEITIDVVDNNDLPTSFSLSSYEVLENLPANTEVATLSATDPDANDTHRFYVIGGPDQAYFRTKLDKLSTTRAIDFEATPTLSIVIQVTDSKKGSLELPVTIHVQDANDAPTGISLSSLTFEENLGKGSPVAQITVYDQDPAFQLVSESLTWQGAHDRAIELGGQLATFSTLDEWVDMVNGVGANTLIDQNIWLGASDAEEEDAWRWIDGTEMTYSRWANPKYVPSLELAPPDNLEDNEHYLAISAQTSKRLEWDDMAEDVELDGFLLETPHVFELIDGKGATDNAFFRIVGDQLQMQTSADFEAKSKYSIRMRVTDPGGLTYEQTFVLNAEDAPDRPEDINLTTYQIAENQPKGFLAARLSAADADSGEKFFFSLSTSQGNDNHLFYILRDELHTHQPFDFEERSEYTIRVQVRDKDGKTYTEDIPLQITDANDLPTGIMIDNASVDENQPKGTLIGKLAAEDPDQNERHTFSIAGGKDQASVYFKRETLYTNVPFDFETKSSLDLIIKVTDKAKAAAEFPLTIDINNINDAPTDIVLSSLAAKENSEAGTLVGNLALLDPDPGISSPVQDDPDFPSYQVELVGDTNVDEDSAVESPNLPAGRYVVRLSKNGPFQAWNKWPDGSPTELGWSNEFWYSANGGKWTGHQTNLYYPTQEAALEKSIPLLLDIQEGKTIKFQLNDGFPQGNRGGLSIDIFQFSAFQLVEGQGDTDNDLFMIEGSQLKLAQSLNYETQQTYSIRVQGRDIGGLTVEKVFILNGIDQPDSPTNIALSNNVLPEFTQGIVTVGTFIITDEDERELHVLDLADHPEGLETDNQFFHILKGRSSSSLITNTKEPFDYEAKPIYNLYVQVKDKDGLTFGNSLQVLIENRNEAPTDLEISNSAIAENLPSGSEVGIITTVDPDAPESEDPEEPDHGITFSDTHTYQLATGEGDTNNRDFRLHKSTGVLTTTKPFNFETDKPRSIRISSTDAAGEKIEKVFIITTTNANDAPTQLTMSPAKLEVEEQQVPGTIIASFSTIDVDLDDSTFGESITLEFTEGLGDTNNGNFEITDGNKLTIKSQLIHQTTPTASFRITAIDAAGESITKVFTIGVTNRNDAPTDVSIDNNSVQENVPFGTVVGHLSAIDPDNGDTHKFKLVSGDGDIDNNSFFVMNGNQLVTNYQLDFESQKTYTIRIQAKDAAGATFEKTLSINVTDEVNEIDRFQLSVIRLPDEGGLTTGAGLHNADTIAALSAQAGPGYTFAGWAGELPLGSDAGDVQLDVLMDSDKTFQAYFARRFHNVEVTVFPDRHGYAKGGGSILYGTEITLLAEELSGEDNVPFSHWRINGVDQTNLTELSLTLTVEDDLSVEAVFNMGLPENFVLIPAGTYSREPEGKYEHTATVSAFYMSTHETSKAQWYEVYNWAIKNGYAFEFDPLNINGRNRAHTDISYDNDFPITGIAWSDMIKWCNARSEMEGWTPVYYTDNTLESPLRLGTIAADKESPTANEVLWRERGYRLPTELEWERAARGGLEGLEYPNGNTIDSTQAYFGKKSNIRSIDFTTQSLRVPNGYGLYDMVGNAWEATWDWYSKNWYANPGALLPDNTGPTLEETGLTRNLRTARGGSGNFAAKQLTVGGRLALKTWGQYAITLRPVFPAPTEPDATITLSSAQAHLGNVSGSGVYQIGSQATLRATPENGAAFVEWQDEGGNVLGNSLTLDLTVLEDQSIVAVFEDTSGNPPLFTLLTFADPADGGTVSGTGAYLAGSTVQITATPMNGLDFAGWSGDAFGTQTTIGVTINQDTRITGAFGDTALDTDRDGLSDLYEKVVGSDPYETDSDGDKLRDGDEVSIHKSDPTKADTDGDGHDDRTELMNDTSPRDPLDFPFFPLNDLVRYFTFRSKPYDYSGNKGHGKATDVGIIADRWEVNKSAFSFNGTSSFVEVSGYNGATGSSARAVSGWVLVEEGDAGPLVSYGVTPRGLEIRINAEGILEVQSDAITLTGATDLADGAWHHFVISLTEAGTVGDLKVYLDGVEEDVTSNGDTGTALTTNSKSPMLIGKNSGNVFFKGGLDDIRIYARHLAASEIAELYDMEVPKEPDVIYPTIVDYPTNQTVAVGDTAMFTVEVKAKPAPTFTWERQIGRNWETIKGATTNTLNIVDAQIEDALNYRAKVSNSEGTVSTRPARLYVKVAPFITQTTEDTAFLINQGGRVYAYVEGSSPLSYEWFKDGKSLGTGKNSYYIPKTANQEEHGGTYSFKVTNEVGEIVSEDFEVSIVEGILITGHPVSRGILEGDSTSLSVTASGGGSLSYQWIKYNTNTRNYDPVSGANDSTYTIDSMRSEDQGIYLCEVDNGASSVTSQAATLEMYIPPTFSVQPTSQNINENGSVTFTSLAIGDPTPTYLWQKYNTDTDEWEDEVRYTRAEMILKKIPRNFAGTYRVKATNSGGTAISEEVELIIYYKPMIETDLDSISAIEGTDIVLSVEGIALDENGSDIEYNWFKNKEQVVDGEGVSGSSTNTLTLSTVDPEDYGSWYCVLSNEVGETQSRVSKLTIIEKPTTVTPLGDQLLEAGDNLLLTVSITGSKPISYQWFKDGEAIEGATLNKLYIKNLTPDDSGAYTFEAENPAGKLMLLSNVTVSLASSSAGGLPQFSDTSDPNADSDGDGLANLLEEALGSDPTNPNSVFTPDIEIVDDGTGQQLVSFHYTESQASGLSTIVEQSTDLQTWEPINPSEAIIDQIDRGGYLQTTIYLPVSGPQKFIRLRVEK